MSGRRNSSSLSNPLFAWGDLAMKTGEMMVASAQVIHHRTSRMAIAGPNPSARDQKEFSLMGQEKLEAMTESMQGMALEMMTMNPGLGLRTFGMMMKSSTAMFSLAASTNLHESLSRQANLARVMTESVEQTSDMTTSPLRIAHKALKPLHSRATANAKRLAKV